MSLRFVLGGHRGSGAMIISRLQADKEERKYAKATNAKKTLSIILLRAVAISVIN